MDNRTPKHFLYMSVTFGDGFQKTTRWGQVGALYENPEGEGFTGYIELMPGQRSEITTKPPEA